MKHFNPVTRREAGKAALIIRPPEDLRIGHTEKNPEELERVYQLGRKEAEKRLEDVRLWLGMK